MGPSGKNCGAQACQLSGSDIPWRSPQLAMPDPSDIHFTHEPGRNFKNGQMVEHVARKLADGRLSAYDMPPIQGVQLWREAILAGQPPAQGIPGSWDHRLPRGICEGAKQEVLQASQQPLSDAGQ